MRLAIAGIAAGLTVLGCAVAHAGPLTPDYAQAPNGVGYGHVRTLTPAWSPVQVPRPDITDTPLATTVVAHPFLSPWVHRLIPVPAGTAVELRGAAQVSVPAIADGRELVVNPNGHCVFDGPTAAAGHPTATALPAVHVDTPGFQLVIEPTVRR